MVAAAIYNANPFRAPDAEPLTPADFVPGLPEEAPAQTIEEQIAVLTAAFGCGPGRPGR